MLLWFSFSVSIQIHFCLFIRTSRKYLSYMIYGPFTRIPSLILKKKTLMLVDADSTIKRFKYWLKLCIASPYTLLVLPAVVALEVRYSCYKELYVVTWRCQVLAWVCSRNWGYAEMETRQDFSRMLVLTNILMSCFFYSGRSSCQVGRLVATK